MKNDHLIFPLLLLFSSCNLFQSMNDSNEIKIELSSKEKAIVLADNEFALEVFQKIDSIEDSENWMISPLSISMALSMAYNGANENTKAEMAEALSIESFTTTELNETYQKLINELTNLDKKVSLEIANSLWYRKGYPVEESFIKANQTYYFADVYEANFNDEKTLSDINNWVSKNTHNKIDKILEEISPDAVLYLINAIYFNGTWAQEFNAESTRTMEFKTANNNWVSVPTMSRLDSVFYFKNDEFASIQLPYGNGNYNMNIILPNHEIDVTEIIKNFKAQNWNSWMDEYRLTNQVDILLPTFKIEYDLTLNAILKKMGMKEAFTTQADFSGINTNRDLYISMVKHKTFIEVDEEGTEAAAVTSIGFETTSIDPGKPMKIPFYCTKPFVFAITERDTNTILFIGKLTNPGA